MWAALRNVINFAIFAACAFGIAAIWSDVPPQRWSQYTFRQVVDIIAAKIDVVTAPRNTDTAVVAEREWKKLLQNGEAAQQSPGEGILAAPSRAPSPATQSGLAQAAEPAKPADNFFGLGTPDDVRNFVGKALSDLNGRSTLSATPPRNSPPVAAQSVTLICDPMRSRDGPIIIDIDAANKRIKLESKWFVDTHSTQDSDYDFGERHYGIRNEFGYNKLADMYRTCPAKITEYARFSNEEIAFGMEIRSTIPCGLAFDWATDHPHYEYQSQSVSYNINKKKGTATMANGALYQCQVSTGNLIP
jgi:hypothetical protein